MKQLIIKKACFYGLMLFLLPVAVVAQDTTQKKDYKKSPVWIQMMRDTSANYYETLRAFREYFQDIPLPKEPGEFEEEETFEKEVGLEEAKEKKSKRELRREARKVAKRNRKYPNLAGEVRAFKGWFYSVQPWVREDGSIVGPAEQQAIVDQQQSELKATEKANGKN